MLNRSKYVSAGFSPSANHQPVDGDGEPRLSVKPARSPKYCCARPTTTRPRDATTDTANTISSFDN